MGEMNENLSTATRPVEFLNILRAERREILNVLRKTRLTTLKPEFPQGQIIPHATYSPWLNDPGFLAIYELARSNTMVDIYRCHELYRLASQMKSVDGDLVEIGVWCGGTAAVLAGAAPQKKIHLFDTFSGVAKADGRVDTLYKGGEHADASAAQVEDLFAKLSLQCAIHVGIFPDDSIQGLPEKISMAHIDVDTYTSAKESFDAIWPRVSASGVVVFDDYGSFGCEGVTQLVGEIVESTPNALMVHNLNGHALLIKKHM